MLDEQAAALRLSVVVGRLRRELGEKVTQAVVAKQAGLDQSRVSRIEQGGVSNPTDIERVFDALARLGSKTAGDYRAFSLRDWIHINPPSFWNPQRSVLEKAEETLSRIENFLGDESRPWPLRRAIEGQKAVLLRGAAYLNNLKHNIAVIGKIGVGKSTALAFAFDLLVPPAASAKPMDRPVLETGGGGTTICEVHIRRGPQYGLVIQPLSEKNLHDLVADFCAAKWLVATNSDKTLRDFAKISAENDRAIRNMSDLKRGTTRGGDDPVQAILQSSKSEEEFRTRVIARMRLGERTRRDLWYEPSQKVQPLEWLARVFREVNNGRLRDVSLPKSIDLIVPEFGREFGELEVTVIDTKGVDDIAVRPDLDLRLRDPRSAVVLCSNFNDAPGVIAKNLLDHMRQTFPEPMAGGKVSILALPRNDEARAMKNDAGEAALDDEEGYALKTMQVANDLESSGLSDLPIIFFNAQSDESNTFREQLLNQLNQMRDDASTRLSDLCLAVEDIIDNHKKQAMIFAVQEVAKRLLTFLDAHPKLTTRERLAYKEVIAAVRNVSHASTLWASTRRGGEYSGLDLIHQIGVGAARDAANRSVRWFASLEDTLKALKKDKALAVAAKTIDQVGRSATATRTDFLEAAQRAGMEVYHERLSSSEVWGECAAEWGQGRGFADRIAKRLDLWFERQHDLKEQLEDVVNRLWEETVMVPLRHLADEAAPAP